MIDDGAMVWLVVSLLFRAAGWSVVLTPLSVHDDYACFVHSLKCALFRPCFPMLLYPHSHQVSAVMVNRMEAMGFNWPTNKAAEWNLHDMLSGAWGATQIDV